MSEKTRLHNQFDIRKIQRDEALQARVKLDQKVVKDYAENMKNGAEFPPLVLYQEGEGANAGYWLADGWHRLEAYKLNQQSKVPVSIYQGTYREARLYALGANAQHGLRRSTADKQRAIDMCLLDPEWQQWSNEVVAKQVKVDPKTVGNRRRHLEREGTIPKITKRKSTRNGKPTTTNTGGIGKKKPSPKPAADNLQNGLKENADKIAFDEVESQPIKNDMPEDVIRRQRVMAMGDSEDLLTYLQDAIAIYKTEHPMMPDVFVQQAIGRLWHDWSGFSNFPWASGLCQCQVPNLASTTDNAPRAIRQRVYVPL